MMQLPLQTFTTLVQNMAAAVQTSATQLLDLTAGSTLRAILEANASLALWLQWLILQVLQMTRAATSTGLDLDSWMADFTLVRMPAAAATGSVTVSRYTPALTALVPVGALVRTADGTQTFAVTADTTNPAFSASQSGYVLAAGVASLTVPVSAQAAGTGGNVQAGAISLLATAMPGIDTVANATAFQNGIDAESDDAFRSRFRNFISSRSRATTLAVGYAIANVQQGLSFTVTENVDGNGAPFLGNFVATVDDGSGAPSANLLASVQAAIDAVRPIGSTFMVRSPTVLNAAISLSVSVGAGVIKSPVTSAVASALAAYVNALPVGASLPVTKLAQLAYEAHPAITNVTNLLVNGGTADIAASSFAVMKTSSVAVS